MILIYLCWLPHAKWILMKNYNFSKPQCSWNLFTCHRINLRLISAGFWRFQSLLHFIASRSSLMHACLISSLLTRLSFLKTRFSRIKNKVLLKIELHWLWHVGSFLFSRLLHLRSSSPQIGIFTTFSRLLTVPRKKLNQL